MWDSTNIYIVSGCEFLTPGGQIGEITACFSSSWQLRLFCSGPVATDDEKVLVSSNAFSTEKVDPAGKRTRPNCRAFHRPKRGQKQAECHQASQQGEADGSPSRWPDAAPTHRENGAGQRPTPASEMLAEPLSAERFPCVGAGMPPGARSQRRGYDHPWGNTGSGSGQDAIFN